MELWACSVLCKQFLLYQTQENHFDLYNFMRQGISFVPLLILTKIKCTRRRILVCLQDELIFFVVYLLLVQCFSKSFTYCILCQTELYTGTPSLSYNW
jgi:hypothetical protein